MNEQDTHFSDSQDDAGQHSLDDVGFEYPPERLARVYAPRPKRKPLEPGALRSLSLAAMVGVGLGAGIYFLKPEPRSANASPILSPADIKRPAKVQLFELPEWDEAAHQQSQK